VRSSEEARVFSGSESDKVPYDLLALGVDDGELATLLLRDLGRLEKSDGLAKDLALRGAVLLGDIIEETVDVLGELEREPHLPGGNQFRDSHR